MLKNKLFQVMKTLLLLNLISYPIFLAQAADQSNNIAVIKKTTQETNFAEIEITEYQYSHPKSQIIIAAEESSSNFFASDRALGKIEKLSFLENQSIKKLTSQNVPQIAGLKPFILDLHFSKDNNRLYASIFYWSKNQKDCSRVKIYEITDDLQNFNPIFESSPCISIQGGFHEISGRLASNDKSIFIASGNVLMDIYNINFPRGDLCCFKKNENYEDLLKKTNLFGSIVKIDKDNFYNKKISIGHRVPEGLFYDKSSNILYSTEHGPRGGDELNIIENNNNYGLPFVTFGITYDKNIGIFNTKLNTHKNYTPPIFIWIPSIGVSQILVISDNDKSFQYWRSSLIVSSLKDKSIHVLKNNGKHIISDERIFIGERLRDLEISKIGLLASTDNGRIIKISNYKKSLAGAFPVSDYDWSKCAIERDSIDCLLGLSKPKSKILKVFHSILN